MKVLAGCVLGLAASGVAFSPARPPAAARTRVWAVDDEAATPKDAAAKEDPKFGWNDLRDLVALGLGAPNLGTFTGVDEETGALQFELDKNRFTSNDGTEYNSFDNSKATYFEGGYVDDSADFMGQLGKFFGGGKKKDDEEKK
ncbi:hypothetical protein M885DRAFT_524436 [Pelagophyceae sp. CCMP2097]|nr:hypothetical protein M885DRAFT_524436 [Pelagophyceae sp. CCMP2097]|mmetsp:Transcript_6909/g.22406  ORF Transcript_6909/g.22406 Transcript_6909/m.22406 type:complete len:143 (+) Transcript_6909:60-488(+)